MLNPQKTQSKFSYIKYPFFGTYEIPEVDIQFGKIRAAVATRYATTHIGISKDYLEELLEIELNPDETRFKFKVTAKSTQELIMVPKRCKWGIDSLGFIHNIDRYEEFLHKCIKLDRITHHKYLWFKEITRPIKIPLSVKNIESDLFHYWYSFLYIDNVWQLYRIREEELQGKTSLWI